MPALIADLLRTAVPFASPLGTRTSAWALAIVLALGGCSSEPGSDDASPAGGAAGAGGVGGAAGGAAGGAGGSSGGAGGTASAGASAGGGTAGSSGGAASGGGGAGQSGSSGSGQAGQSGAGQSGAGQGGAGQGGAGQGGAGQGGAGQAGAGQGGSTGGAGPGGGSGSGGMAGSAGGAAGSGGDAGAADLPMLAAPPAGGGVQIDTGHFDVPAGSEMAGCHFFAVKDLAANAGLDPSQPLNVHRIEVAQLAGTHDMTIYEVRTVDALDPANGAVQVGMNGKGPCYDEKNTADWPVMTNSLQPEAVDWKLPDGVAYSLDPDRWVMVKTHYANTTTQKTPDGGRVKVNLWAIPSAQVTAQLGVVRTTRKAMRVCQSNPAPKFEGACTFGLPSSAQIVGANVLTHGRGVAARLWTWDGVSQQTPPDADRFYESKAWDAPPSLAWPALSASAPSKGGFWLECDYAWQPPPAPLACGDLDAYDAKTGLAPDCCYDDGPQVDLNERCSATVYYWPKSDLENCQ